MATEPSSEELALVDEISRLGVDLWDESLKISGLNTDPKMFSIMLFRRLWSHHRGFVLLWNSGLYLEGDIILRAGIEAAICIAANFNLREEFVAMMRQDAAFTVMSQVKLLTASGEIETAKAGELQLEMLVKGFPEGAKAKKLDWSDLAKRGGVPQLYGFHRHLSGTSAHVTGLSVLQDVGGSEETESLQAELKAHTKRTHLMMMVGATLNGALLHGGMIDCRKSVERAHGLIQQMNEVSKGLPGVGEI